MRERQLELEDKYLQQTSLEDFLNGLDTFRDTDTLVELCNLVEKGIKDKHDSVKRKRSPFFKLTKDLSDSEVAFMGVKGLLSSLVFSNSLPVTTVATTIGNDIMVATGLAKETFDDSEKKEVDSVSTGIVLLDIIIKSLTPLKLIRASLEVETKTKRVWTLSVTDKWEGFLEDNKEIFTRLVAKKMPMVSKPDDWKDMMGGGYYSETGKALAPLVKGKHKHESPVGDGLFDAINHLQGTPHRINQRIFGLYETLKATRPDEMSKLFINNLPKKFSEECPIDKDNDSYLWEKEDGEKTDPKTGKVKKCQVLRFRDEESNEKRKAYFKWVDRRDAYIKKCAAKESLDRSLLATIEVTNLVKDEPELYWPYGCDARSRVYPAAMTGINLQGADCQKAVLEFAVGLPLDFDGDGEGGEYGIIKTLCNHWGNDSGNGVKTDKLTEEDARKWVSENTDWIAVCANNPLENPKWMQADKPLQFLSAAFEWVAWQEYYKVNKDYGFISRLPDPNDASCSGAQILSAMTRDIIGARHTNLCALPDAQDLYMAVADKALDTLLSVFKEDPMSQDWLGRKNVLARIQDVLAGKEDDILSLDTQQMIIERSKEFSDLEELYLNTYLDFGRLEQQRLSFIIRNLVKKPVMVKFYSGTRYGNIQHCSEFIVEKSWEDNFRCDGTGQAASYMGNLIYDSINQVITGAGLVMEWFVHVADTLGNCGKPVKWTTPMGFKTTMKKYATKNLRIKVEFLGEARQFTLKVTKLDKDLEGKEYKVLDVAKMKSGVAPDIVHSLDASLIQAVSLRCKQEGIDYLLMIHDSLGAHCCYTRRFNRIIREEFIKMFETDILQNLYEGFKSQLDEDQQNLLLSPEQFGIKYGDYDLQEMLNSVHCFK